jgi:glycosyltransferase involved in cell wall biosynthesis
VARGRGYKNVDAVLAGVGALGDGQLALVGSPSEGQGDEPHARWLGVVSDAQLRWLYAHARALVSVSYEDFGLTPLEANAFGTPVAVLRAGGFLDSLAEGVSGTWVEEPTAEAVRDALRAFPAFDADAVRAHAARFDERAFGERLQQKIAELTT